MSIKEVTRYKKIVVFSILLFFTVFVILDLLFIYIAKQSYRGVVTENAYDKGVQYTRSIRMDERQRAIEVDMVNSVVVDCPGYDIVMIHNKGDERSLKNSLKSAKFTYAENANPSYISSTKKSIVCKVAVKAAILNKNNGSTIKGFGTNVRAKLLRPVTSIYDSEIVLNADKSDKSDKSDKEKNSINSVNSIDLINNSNLDIENSYTGEIIIPLKGLWELRLHLPVKLLNDDDDDFDFDFFIQRRFYINDRHVAK